MRPFGAGKFWTQLFLFYYQAMCTADKPEASLISEPLPLTNFPSDLTLTPPHEVWSRRASDGGGLVVGG